MCIFKTKQEIGSTVSFKEMSNLWEKVQIRETLTEIQEQSVCTLFHYAAGQFSKVLNWALPPHSDSKSVAPPACQQVQQGVRLLSCGWQLTASSVPPQQLHWSTWHGATPSPSSHLVKHEGCCLWPCDPNVTKHWILNYCTKDLWLEFICCHLGYSN